MLKRREGMSKKKEFSYQWKKLSEEKPPCCGKYAVVTRQKSNVYLKPACPCEVIINWARWDYEEQLNELRGDLVIYKKNFRFFSWDKDGLENVVYWCELPVLPEELRNAINKMDS